MRSVCVIGAGVAGIVAARYLREHFAVTLLEASCFIGGVWLYDKEAEGKSTPMYKNLKTNLPKQLMVFRDLEHDEELPSFLEHYQVLSYLERYCEKFDIRSLIKFNTRVDLVKPDFSAETMRWSVHTDSGETRLYDALAVCTGRYDIPNIPAIPDLRTYRGKYTHSKEYKVPDPYRNHRVLVVGHRASAIDIVIDLHVHGANVSISHRKGELLNGLPEALVQHPEPIRFDEDTVYFKDDTSAQFDVIIFATGYETNLDFIDASCGITVETLPRPLYKYFINPKYPTMIIADQCYQVAPFPLCEYQAIYFRELLLGSIQLPEEEELLQAAHEIIQRNPDKPLKYKYALELKQFRYYAELASECDVEVSGPLDFTALHDLYRDVSCARGKSPMTYRNDRYEFIEEVGKFERI